uniref:Uncharacterized protein n=1 Tax=Podoviridae sp. ctaNW81 TaxID=2826562 RepID=A0A8S5M5D9_9CAUD|nr:MAG TPA: hypothetical protein [Podoviridae sp. ctaNW81]
MIKSLYNDVHVQVTCPCVTRYVLTTHRRYLTYAHVARVFYLILSNFWSIASTMRSFLVGRPIYINIYLDMGYPDFSGAPYHFYIGPP